MSAKGTATDTLLRAIVGAAAGGVIATTLAVVILLLLRQIPDDEGLTFRYVAAAGAAMGASLAAISGSRKLSPKLHAIVRGVAIGIAVGALVALPFGGDKFLYAERLRAALITVPLGAILGGSLSYLRRFHTGTS